MEQGGSETDEAYDGIIQKSAMVAMIVGVAIAAFLIWSSLQESYSAVYIYPDSYTNYINVSDLPKEITFRYGIVSHETRDEVYKISIFLNGKLIKSKQVKIKRGETFEELESVTIPKNVKLPAKVSVVVEVGKDTYEAHFWIRGSPS
ncbi:hypothetical protein [Archaeoglobus neptunius]|uniref:hypothetical protein n=1 Tax=Archaeoglobus neptunius TaxID=2798580 RepID=UPI0019267E89|nr:hypothetical protein [Archaeoglobus neptunius]